MDISESPAKRIRLTPPIDSSSYLDTNADFVAFDTSEDNLQAQSHTSIPTSRFHGFTRREDPRHRHDKPKSKHSLPETESWLLVKTKLGRRFVHNVKTKESFWRIPQGLQAAVDAFDIEEEKARNMQWSEDQLKLMRQQEKLAQTVTSTLDRRRRSESLQREDEAAMMAELAAQAEYAEEQDARKAALAVADIEPRGYLGDASDSEYEYIEVTDTEGEGEDQDEQEELESDEDNNAASAEPIPPGPVDFGEDDIAYQLAMMGESYGLDPEEYQEAEDERDYDQEANGLALSDQEAIALFNQMLDEHEISPFTPWDKLIADESAHSIVFDERYTVLQSSRARKEAWDQWSRDRAAAVKVQRATEEKKDPRVAYLSFLAANASTKLYWPEFKRKFKRESEMNDRALQDKDREKLYRDLVAKLKLPESKRKDELKVLLKAVPEEAGRRTLPSKILSNVSLYVLPQHAKDELFRSLHFD
ncbi:hypothetical protein AMS68_007404 [Peltaster fructicola]|uniref:WW domain-containing protein n=1 Tax=Peltaster fructicola TaxID=286661 RepID=A0A6H0Y4D1_9PEZI|nr:hypothetical protein AMS68_007404 [Peltaster fructicola]